MEQTAEELGKVGLKLSPDNTYLTSNRAGMHFSCWFSYANDAAGLEELVLKLKEQKWKLSSG